jgi:hypothetical protein
MTIGFPGRILSSQTINGQPEVCVIIQKKLLEDLDMAHDVWVDAPDLGGEPLEAFSRALYTVMQAAGLAPKEEKSPAPQIPTSTQTIIDKYMAGDIPL